MDENNKKPVSIDIEETNDMLERDKASSALMNVAVVFVGVALFFSLHSLVSIFHYLADDTVPLVACPRSFDLDAPVLMKSIGVQNAEVQDRRLRGFIRRVITSQMPRVEKDVVPFFQFMVSHSEGSVQDHYQSFLNGKSDITSFINAGYYIRFYPKFTLASLGDNSKSTDDSGLRIRKSDKPGVFVIEQDGYLVKKMEKNQERTNITLRYEVTEGKQTLHNPEGLYVTEANVDQISDFISGNKETKEHF
jgi:hypothetical protein